VNARLPTPTIRLRLTLVYGGLFLACGTALLTITYFLVRHQYTGGFFVSSGRAGIVAVTNRAQGFSVRGTKISGPVTLPSPATIAAAARSQSAAALHQLFIDSGIALAVMAVLSIWLGWVIAGRALSPLRTITNAARNISASSLHKRLALDGPDDELKQLANTFDDLLGRLEAAFDAQRQFVANASHELRTPLTLERTLLEVALSDPHVTLDSLRDACERVIAVGEHHERLLEALLTLSRSQRGLERREAVDLAAIAGAAAEAVDRNGLAIETSLTTARTTGDSRLVERLAANLVGNAVRHNVPGGSVRVETETRDDRAVLRIANTGPAVPRADLGRLFRPFQRLDAGRAADADGLGLGLSIVDAVANAHDAAISATPQPDGGLLVEVAFPAAR
jgi:signal transduction histidine kinase